MGSRPTSAAVEGSAAYELLGESYDRWCRSVTEDIAFYTDLALESGGPVLEIGVGSGRVAVPVALTGVPVVGVDASPVMLDLARKRAAGHDIDLTLL
jgi:ubiquinone/menaquinone biosynthesis C-methylase UbiE